jgi:hypothetical protein
MANRNTKHNQVKFCKFCKDSGKNETIYTSHTVKDKNGNVCCPILMTTLCNNCGNFGHTLKFCKSIKVINQKNTNKNYIQKPTNIRVEIKNKNENRFTAFENDDNDDDDKNEIPVVKEEVFVPRRRIENWADYCSDTDDD